MNRAVFVPLKLLRKQKIMTSKASNRAGWSRSPAAGAIAFCLSLTISLVLLLSVGLAEAYRVYPDIARERLQSQGEIVQNSLERFLKADLPLDQFPGFQTMVSPLLASDPSLRRIEVVDPEESVVFVAEAESASTATDHDAAEAGEELDSIQLPLQSRFEQVGRLEISMAWSAIAGTLKKAFLILALVCTASILISTFVVFSIRQARRYELFLNLIYSVTFIAMSMAVIYTLMAIYSDGIRGKARALGESLSSRVGVALQLELDPEKDLEGIDRILNKYTKLNPDLRSLQLRSLTGKVFSSKQPTGSEASLQGDDYVTVIPVGAPNDSRYEVVVRIPKQVVYSKLSKSAKNFLALFGGVWLLSQLFLNLFLSLKGSATEDTAIRARHQLELVRPFYTVSVLMEGLCVSFLPVYFQDVLQRSGVGAGGLSTLFLLYFAAFAFSLIPSGRFAQKYGPRALFQMSILFSAIGLWGLTLIEDPVGLAAMRVLSGAGQGMSLVAAQSYILRTVAVIPALTARGSALIVLGYQTGMIAGNALGALLVVYTGPRAVFLMAGLLGLLNLLFARRILIPEFDRLQETAEPQADSPSPTKKDGGFWSDLWAVLKDREVIQAVLLVGVPTKALLAGVVIFGMPLMLNSLGYSADDIGMILMFYAAGVLASNTCGDWLQRKAHPGKLLVVGACGGGGSLILIGGGHFLWPGLFVWAPWLEAIFLVAGIGLLGLFHGLIHAPILTYVASSELADRMGSATVTSTYRFLERLGTLLGPLIVAPLLTLNDQSLWTVAQIGAGVFTFGLLFSILKTRSKK